MTRRWLLPEHIEDVLPDEARSIERLRRAILDLFETHGYELVRPPLLEYVESLLSGTGRDLDLATFKLVDRLSGRLMGVRADHTPQVARIDAHLLNRKGVTRLCYCGSVLHTVPEGMTRMREPIQIGAELYGHAGLEADVEVLRLMISALQRSGIARVHIDLGHPSIYRTLTADAPLDAEDAEALFNAVQQKDAPLAAELGAKLPAQSRDAVVALTSMNGEASVLARARQELPARPGVRAALDALEQLAARCSVMGVDVSVDLAELGGFNYESGVVFAAFTAGSPDVIARGGRYDEVGRSFGRARPATGFTMDLRQLAALAPAPAHRRRILAPAGDAPGLAEAIEKLRSKGEIVVVDLPGHGDAADEAQFEQRLVMKEGRWALVPGRVKGED